ncbi:hypothetical protein BK636_02030 [Pseudomonas chlororaphis]|uniref:hypothetical protein n=1 Tax=Pseudomonas chlororaphis TaxID=587753 RepID=UPI000F48DC51|nr:hypothetical protein [Pseudomonas chlororaphis]ROL94151.1 hypothetical protein BK636_02030 [Pseudomonas chlororaphis]
MYSRVANTLFTLVFIAATASAALPSATDSFPHIPMMTHQTMTFNDKVIYEADVDFADPHPTQVALKINIDEFSWNCLTLAGHVNGASSGEHSGANLVSGYTISCVVRDLKADGTAQVDIVYTLRNPSRGIDKSEHISAMVQAGQRYESRTQSGARVAMLLQIDRT